MTQGDNEAKIQVIRMYLELNGSGGQMYGGQEQRQDQRRQQASQLMGGSQSQSGMANSTQGLSGEALFDAIGD